MRPCVFCGSTAGRATDEHVIPKWARDGFDIQEWVTIDAADPGAALEHVGRQRHLNIVFRDGLCAQCNNEWLGPIENQAKAILLPMALEAKPTVLDAASQALLAFWAVKTVFLLEFAFRQRYRNRSVAGYLATELEMAWLRAKEQPPPNSMVWIGCWDCEQKAPARYEPSAASVPAAMGDAVAAHVATFTLGFVAFQVFSLDFVAAEARGADIWSWTWEPPEALRAALPRIWPPQLVVPDVSWPPSCFRRDDWRRLVTWDEARRPPGHQSP
jgi:hypothetical protein